MNKKLGTIIGLGLSAMFLQSCQTTETKAPNQTDNSVEINWIQDKPGNHVMGNDVFPNVPDSLRSALNIVEGIPSSISAFLMKAEGKAILFDSGLGMEESLLTEGLKNLGYAPEDIELIYLTHLHFDHIGGLLKNGAVAFPNATVYLNKVEYDAWMAMDTAQNKMQRIVLDAYKEMLQLFQAGDTLPAHVVSMAAYGHTPGHTVYQKDSILVIGDVMHGAQLQLAHPEYSPVYDMDPEMATQTRMRILDLVKKEGLVMAGMHLPNPGIIE